MQDHEVHCMEKVQMVVHRTHLPHHCCALYRHPLVLFTELHLYEDREATSVALQRIVNTTHGSR